MAIASHLEILAKDDAIAPAPSKLGKYYASPEYAGATWMYAGVDVFAFFFGGTVKAAVTLPKLLIRRIDAMVAGGGAKSRSAFLADSALRALGW